MAVNLRDRIGATLDANADIRRQAEIDLKHAEEQPGFIEAIMNILESEQDAGIRLSSVVYFKNRITKGWAPNEDHTNAIPIPNDEKPLCRQRIIPLLAVATPQVRSQLIPTVQKILSHDFPARWPEFLDITIQLLQTNDANSVFAGVQCLLTICRVYRFKATEARGDFDKVVGVTFPLLLNIGTGLLNETSIEAGEMLRALLKTYKHAIYFELPHALRGHDAMVGWCTLFLGVISKEPPPSALPEDLEEREKNHWWKAKKWSYANLNRLFMRYGNPTTLPKSHTEDYTEVAKSFIINFAPEILKVYLQEIEKWVGKTVWLSRGSLSYTLQFLDECVKPKVTWDHLKPHMETLIAHLLFPVLCQSDEDLELFTDDPAEYLHRKMSFFDEISSPDIAATSFLVTLTKARRNQTFVVLKFVNELVTKYEEAPEDQKNAREKEGALRMIGTLAPVILGKKSPVVDQVELFFVRHVFPEFRSPHGFLRARACDTLEKFEKLDFKDENNLFTIYRNVLASMADPELPVRVGAAIALQPLIRHDAIRVAMQANIPQIMQQLLKLANEVDVDALANVMEEFVEVFASELTPFAVALSEQLRDTYLRLVRDVVEKNALGDDSDEYGDYLDDKSITALGVLQTIGTLILTLESTPDVLLHMETILMPVIEITLQSKLFDLFNEVFEIIDSCTFAAKTISPTMWHAFELIYHTFKHGAELYLEDMLPALENFVNYGAPHLMVNKGHLDAVIDIVRTIFKDDKLVGGVERICGCKLAEVVMLALRGHLDEHITELIQLSMFHLTSEEHKVKSYKMYLMEMVINAIYYNPRLALHYLESSGQTNKFFSLWFSNIDSFTRVHDKKLAIATINELLSLQAHEIPVSVQQGWPRLLTGVVRLFQTLPAAIKNRDEVTREENYDFSNEVDEEDEEEWQQPENWENEVEEGGDIHDENSTYLDFLTEEARKFASHDDEDELEEDNLLDTAIDKLEPYGMFKTALLNLQQQQPELYQDLTKNLTPDEQTIIQVAINQADTIALSSQHAQDHQVQQAQAIAQQQAQQGQVQVPQIQSPPLLQNQGQQIQYNQAPNAHIQQIGDHQAHVQQLQQHQVQQQEQQQFLQSQQGQQLQAQASDPQQQQQQQQGQAGQVNGHVMPTLSTHQSQ